MKTSRQHVLVLITAPDRKTARKLIQVALTDKLIACANIIPKIESHYWWQSKIEFSAELLLICKTTRNRLVALEKAVLANHPYDTPEFVVLPLSGGNQKYLAWLTQSVT